MNCIWITTDSFRQDHVRCYRPAGALDEWGPGLQVQTPHLDALAAESAMFDRMRAEALPTIPCRRGIFTGRRVFPWASEPFPKGLSVRLPGWRPLPQGETTVAEHLAQQGYVTACVADCYHLMKPSMNFHRGFQGFHWVRGQEFDRWQTQALGEGVLERHLKAGVALEARRTRVLEQFLRNHAHVQREEDLPAARTVRWAVRWLERNAAHERFFLYVDTFSPHEPWLAPKRYLDLYESDYGGADLIYGNPYARSQLSDAEHRHLRARYAAACTMVDHWIGRLLEAVDRLGLRETTVVVVMSDHGKIVGEFGHYGMPASDTGPALSPVPCLLRHPRGCNAGRRFRGWLYNIDLTATVLGLLGVEPKGDVEGLDVWPAVTDNADGFRDHLVTAYANVVAAWRDEWLYLLDTDTHRAALYNLADDVHRKTDVSGRYPGVCDDLAARIADVMTGGSSGKRPQG